jgi:hypothetical protein
MVIIIEKYIAGMPYSSVMKQAIENKLIGEGVA